MSKNWDDMTNEEKIENHNQTRMYTVGRAAMAERLELMFLTRAGEFFKKGDDSSAQEFRELSQEMNDISRAERKSQKEVEAMIEALEKQDAPADPSP